jgi:hypothetical protein
MQRIGVSRSRFCVPINDCGTVRSWLPVGYASA